MKDYVLSRALDPVLHVVEAHDLDETELIRGLSFTHEDLRSSFYRRIPWDEFALYFQRVEDLVGPEPIDNLGKILPSLISFRPFLKASGRLASPRWYFHASKYWFGPTMFPAVELTTFEDAGPRRLHVAMEIPDHLRDCPQFFRATASFDREGPTFLGMEPARVKLSLTPRRGDFMIDLPPSLSLPARLRRAVTAALSSDELMEEYAAQHESLVASFEDVRRSETSFRDLVEHSPDAVIIFDDDKIHYLNQAAVRLLGPLSELSQQPAILATLLGDHQGVPDQIRLTGREGRPVDAEFRTMNAHFQGHPVHVSILQDVTLRNEVLARAMEMDRIVSMGMVAAGVGHDIKNPLSFVHSNLEFFRDVLSQPSPSEADLDDVREALDATLRGVDRIRSIAADLNSFAREPTEDLDYVDLLTALQPPLRWVESMLHDRATLKTTLAAKGPVWSNAHRISQVVLNLLVNAAHAIEPGSPADNEVHLMTRSQSGQVTITVEDTGSGIPEEHQERVFEPFFTTKPSGQGTGLGLFLTREIVHRLGGEISLSSTPGQGTRVTLILPRHSPDDTD